MSKGVGPGRYSVGDLAKLVSAELVGDPALVLSGVAGLSQARSDQLSFLANKKYRKALIETRAGAIVTSLDEEVAAGKTLLRVTEPYLAFAKISTVFNPPRLARAGHSPKAFIHDEADVDPSAEVMAFAYVGRGARIGARTTLHPGVHVGEEALVGDDCILYANVAVRERCRIGHRVILQAGSVIGSDGFGFAFDSKGENGSGPRHFKVPQIGTVRIEDDVEIGSCACVDRAALGETIIGRGTKIDNLVQVGHNVEIGPLCLLAGQAGIAGSTRLGKGCVIAGQVGIVGHAEIGDRVTVGAQSGVTQDIPANEIYLGTPARPQKSWIRNAIAFDKLAEMVKEMRRLRKLVATLKLSSNERSE